MKEKSGASFSLQRSRTAFPSMKLLHSDEKRADQKNGNLLKIDRIWLKRGFRQASTRTRIETFIPGGSAGAGVAFPAGIHENKD